jgi:hypothetical protein
MGVTPNRAGVSPRSMPDLLQMFVERIGRDRISTHCPPAGVEFIDKNGGDALQFFPMVRPVPNMALRDQ